MHGWGGAPVDIFAPTPRPHLHGAVQGDPPLLPIGTRPWPYRGRKVPTLPTLRYNMRYTFYGATSFNGDLSRWDVRQVTDMRVTFMNATSFTQQLGGFWSQSRADRTNMFNQCPGSIV